MKRNFLSTLLLASAATLFFASCDDDRSSEVKVNAPATTGQITIDGTHAVASTGILQYATKAEKSGNTAVYRHELGLITNGFSTNYDAAEGLMLQGEGTGLWLEIASGSKTLEEGTYVFTGSQDNSQPFDFWYGSADVKGTNYLFTGGQITVKKTNTGYSIQVDGSVSTVGSTERKNVSATFDGQLQNFQSR